MDGISNYVQFVSLHKPQLIASGVPELFWETLCKKLLNHIYDAGEAFQLLLIDYSGDESDNDNDGDDVQSIGNDNQRIHKPTFTVQVTNPRGIRSNDPTQIYIIDHAWTFRFDRARQNLRQIPGLLNRMSIMMGITSSAGPDEHIDILTDDEDTITNRINRVLNGLWQYVQMYTIGGGGGATENNDNLTIENRMPIWYILDELGSAVHHSDTPNFRIVPFMYVPEQQTYSLLFPIANCDGFVTRDFVENVQDPMTRTALLLPWEWCDFKDESFEQFEPTMEYFQSGHIDETLPLENVHPPMIAERSRPLKVYSEYNLINTKLTSPLFQICDNMDEADILWLTHHFKTYREFSESTPNKFVNQFPFENVLTIKDLLSIVCRRGRSSSTNNNESAVNSLETHPKWLPTTYNLKTELIQFVSYYQHREEQQLDNHWIIKPWNLARGLDIYITDDVRQIMRLQQTGPKIAQKYIEKPVLFDRSDDNINGLVKFDVRYVILLKSTTEAYIYRNFFLRFANKPFALNQFDDYQQHFTVMNYGADFQLRHIKCDEFLRLWQQQYPDSDWETIETDICKMLNEMLMGAIAKGPPCGIGNSVQSRALYAADIMLAWENDDKIQPKLLEVNWIPDCQRACDYYPEFFNDIFKLLFLNEDVDENVFRNISM